MAIELPADLAKWVYSKFGARRGMIGDLLLRENELESRGA